MLVVVHTAICLFAMLIAIAFLTGVVQRQISNAIYGSYLVATALAALSGFLLPMPLGFADPAIVIGIVSMIMLLTIFVVHSFAIDLNGYGRSILVFASVLSAYLLYFVAVARAFKDVPALHKLAEDAGAPVLNLAEGAVLAVFGIILIAALRPGPRDPQTGHSAGSEGAGFS